MKILSKPFGLSLAVFLCSVLPVVVSSTGEAKSALRAPRAAAWDHYQQQQDDNSSSSNHPILLPSSRKLQIIQNASNEFFADIDPIIFGVGSILIMLIVLAVGTVLISVFG